MMVDMTSSYQRIIVSLDEDIANIEKSLEYINRVRVKWVENKELEQVIKTLGGEIAWLQSKKLEADKYLTH